MTDPGSFHRRAWDLIPWVVNGSADDTQRQFVEKHLLECAGCRNEYELHRRLHTGIEARHAEPHDPEPALRRLSERLAAEETMTVSRQTAMPQRWPSWSRMLIAASVLQAVGLGVLSAVIWDRSQGFEYRTLSEPGGTPPVAAIRFVPASEMTMEQFQSLLARTRLHVVEMNVEGGIFKLATPPGSDGQATANALAALRAEPGVALAEPLQGDR